MDIKLPEIAVDLLLNIINIIVLFVIVKAIVYKPVKKFLDERKSKIKEETEKAQKMLDLADETLSRKEELIKEGTVKGEELAEKTLSEAKENAKNIIDDAKRSADNIIKKANSEIEVSKQEMINSSKDEIAELAVNIAERILQRETNEQDNKKIVDEFFSEV